LKNLLDRRLAFLKSHYTTHEGTDDMQESHPKMCNRVCNSSFPKAANPATRHEFRLWILTTRPLRVSSAVATNTASGKKSKTANQL
jgi:hypothetical protein